MCKALIDRLLDRIRREPSVDMDSCPPARPNPPVSERAFAQAEAEIGFPLPPLLCASIPRSRTGDTAPEPGSFPLLGTRGHWSSAQVDLLDFRGCR